MNLVLCHIPNSSVGYSSDFHLEWTHDILACVLEIAIFFFKMDLSNACQHLTISLYKSSDIPKYGPALRKMKLFCMLVMIC